MAKYDLYDKKLAGEKIRRWQLETGLQGREIAKWVGISAPYFSDIHKGKQRGSLPVLAKIADVLGRSVEDLSTDQRADQKSIRVAELRKALRPLFQSEYALYSTISSARTNVKPRSVSSGNTRWSAVRVSRFACPMPMAAPSCRARAASA